MFKNHRQLPEYTHTHNYMLLLKLASNTKCHEKLTDLSLCQDICTILGLAESKANKDISKRDVSRILTSVILHILHESPQFPHKIFCFYKARQQTLLCDLGKYFT